MLSALLWKEWRQLRALCLAGLALGVVLPLASIAGASVARHGFAPLGKVGEDATRTILLELLPAALAMALWPLGALLVTSQAFAGDRAAGVEGFLLERPVSRTRTWLARLLASLGATLAIAVGTGLIWALFAWTSVSPTALDWSSAGQLFALGGLLTALTLSGAVAAAALVPAPVAAVLLGLLFSLIPVILAYVLGSRFPLAAIHGLRLGVVVPWVLVPAFFLASWIALCRGEPAGRGRVFRSSAVLSATLALSIATFFSLAPLVVRYGADPIEKGALVAASSTRPTALVGSRAELSAAWLVDVKSGERLAFFPPPVHQDSVWSTDGKTIAIVTGSAPFGGLAAEPRIEFLDAEGHRVGRAVEVPGASWWEGIRWAGDRIVVRTWRDRSSGIVIVDPATGAAREPDLRRNGWTLGLVGPTDDGRVYVAVGPADAGRAPANAQDALDYTVHRVDVERAAIAAEPLLRDRGHPWTASARLSPSGRYWRVDGGADRCDTRPLLDIESSKETSPQVPYRSVHWLAGDALAWLETDGTTTWLLLGRPGEPARPLRGWRGLEVELAPSPDLARLLVHASALSKERSKTAWMCQRFRTPGLEGLAADGTAPESRVYEVATGRWTGLPTWAPEADPSSWCSRVWAGPRTLARTGPGYFALEDLDHPGVLRPVIGK
jgi:hypothetical protein